MKYFSVVLASSLLMLTGCDRSVPILINKDKTYSVETSCGKVDFSAYAFSNWINIGQSVETGEFELNFDSLTVSVLPEGTTKLDTIRFYDVDKLIKVNKKIVKSGERIIVSFIFNRSVYTSPGTLLILPCKYIMCDGKPLITDTLRINF